MSQSQAKGVRSLYHLKQQNGCYISKCKIRTCCRQKSLSNIQICRRFILPSPFKSRKNLKIQWGAEIRPFKIWKLSKSGLFEGQISNSPYVIGFQIVPKTGNLVFRSPLYSSVVFEFLPFSCQANQPSTFVRVSRTDLSSPSSGYFVF